MVDEKWLAERFDAQRGQMRKVAYRLLGSPSEADDAVQEAWLRLSRSGSTDIENLGGWLTTVVSRVCLDMLRARKSRQEEPLETHAVEVANVMDETDPEKDVLFADSVGLALIAVLERLEPAERVAFVLHDMFDLPFDDIAPIVGRTSAATRQLASRARRRVRGVAAHSEADRTRQSVVVDAFLAASRGGDLEALLAVLDPDVVLRVDRASLDASEAGRAKGAPILAPEIRGAAAVAKIFSGRAQAAQPAFVDGAAALVWSFGGQPRVVFNFTIADGKVIQIDQIADPERLGQFDIVLVDN
jgi:RNA polymerase sigma-70 factor (ECF subfamily)